MAQPMNNCTHFHLHQHTLHPSGRFVNHEKRNKDFRLLWWNEIWLWLLKVRWELVVATTKIGTSKREDRNQRTWARAEQWTAYTSRTVNATAWNSAFWSSEPMVAAGVFQICNTLTFTWAVILSDSQLYHLLCLHRRLTHTCTRTVVGLGTSTR